MKLLIIIILIFYHLIDRVKFLGDKIIFSDFLKKLYNNSVLEVTIRGYRAEGIMHNGNTFYTFIPEFYYHLIDDLKINNIKFDILPIDSLISSVIGGVFYLLPTIFFILIWIFFTKNNKFLNFKESKTNSIVPNLINKMLFSNVAGLNEAKEDLEEIIDFLQNPKKFRKLGCKIPKGCLLIGSPGTGKTLLARATAGESNVPFFTVSGSEFIEMFAGVGSLRVRNLFSQAKQYSPCIIFIDEIDAMGKHRGMGMNYDEREQTLNQLLTEMDGFTQNQGIIVMAATNRFDVLDPALLRSGRFDRQINVSIPNIKERREILIIHSQRIPLCATVNMDYISKSTSGCSGADLANLMNEAALITAKYNKRYVTMQELEYAKDRIMMGVERKSLDMSNEQKKIIAYHEGGHALIAINCSNTELLYKASIIPRTRSLGMVITISKDNEYNYSKEKLKNKLTILMGGRVAEEIVFGKNKTTTGASNDIEIATNIARNMVTKWGFSEVIGPISINNKSNSMYSEKIYISDKFTEIIDIEIKKTINTAYLQAVQIIKKKIYKLHIIAEALIKYETLTGIEIQTLIQNA